MNYEITISVHVPDELIRLGEFLQGHVGHPADANGVAQTDTVVVVDDPTPEPEEVAEPIAEVTREVVIAQVKDALARVGKGPILAIWDQQGVERLSEVPDDKLAEVSRAVLALGAK